MGYCCNSMSHYMIRMLLQDTTDNALQNFGHPTENIVVYYFPDTSKYIRVRTAVPDLGRLGQAPTHLSAKMSCTRCAQQYNAAGTLYTVSSVLHAQAHEENGEKIHALNRCCEDFRINYSSSSQITLFRTHDMIPTRFVYLIYVLNCRNIALHF